MPVFTLQSPDGRKIKIEAADEATAMRGAQEWSSSAPPKAKRGGLGGVVDEVGSTISGAVDKLKTDSAKQYKAGSLNLPEFASDAVNALTSPLTGAINAAVVKPAANALAAIPFQAYDKPTLKGPGAPLDKAQTRSMWEGAVNQGLSALGPKGPARTPKPPGVNALAEPLAAFERAGVRPSLASVQGGGAAKAANAIAENPIAGIRARNALRGTVEDVGASAERVAGKYGAATSKGAAGEAVQEGVRGFNDRFSSRSRGIYDKAFADIDAGQASAVKSAQGQAAIMTGSGSPKIAVVEPKVTAETLRGMGARVNSAPLSKIITDKRLAGIADALEAGGQDLRFGDLRDLRTWVREAQKDDALRQGMTQGGLKRLEGALTQDIMTNAERLGGPRAARKLKQADTFYRLGSQRIEGALQSFVGKSKIAPKAGESTFDTVLRAAGDKGGADTARLTALKKSLGREEWNDIAATTIDRMGKPTAGAAEQGDFSVNRFVTGYNGLSEEGRNLLFGTGELRQELDNLHRVAGMVKTVEKGANASNSGTAIQSIGTVGGLVNPATTVPTAGLLGGLSLAGEAMTNPKVVRWMAKLGTAQARSPTQLQATVAALGNAARSNVALLPLYQETTKLLMAPTAAKLAAEEQDPEQPR